MVKIFSQWQLLWQLQWKKNIFISIFFLSFFHSHRHLIIGERWCKRDLGWMQKKMNLERKVCFVIRIKLSGSPRNGFVRIEIEIANDDPIVFRVSRLPRNAKKKWNILLGMQELVFNYPGSITSVQSLSHFQ